MLTKVAGFSARSILTFQLWEFQRCEAMLRVRSTKQELHRQKCDIWHFASNKENSDDCGEPVPPNASASAKTASTIVDLSKNLHSMDAEIRLVLIHGQLLQQLQLLCWCRCYVPSHVSWQPNCVSIFTLENQSQIYNALWNRPWIQEANDIWH